MTTATDLPAFSAIKPAEVEGSLRTLLDANRAELDRLLNANAASWDALIVPLEEMQHRLSRTWSPVGHMNGVVNSDELRAAYNACLPLLSAWNTDLGQNVRLYQAYETVLKNEGARMTAGQRKLVENALRDFRLAGVALPRSEEHTSELQSLAYLVCRLLLEKK